MWTAVLGIISSLVSYFFKSKTTEQQDIATGTGIGITAQKEADDVQTLHDIQTAKDASDGVTDAPGDFVRDPANSGPKS